MAFAFGSGRLAKARSACRFIINSQLRVTVNSEKASIRRAALNDSGRLSAELELTEAYWGILHFMRAYWREHQVTPDVRRVVGFLTEEQGLEKKVAKEQLFQLFPYGYVQQACKIAGMIKPRAWSAG